VHLQSQHLRLPPGQDLDLRHEPRADPVADEVGETLLLIQRVGHAAHIAAAILHPDQQGAAFNITADQLYSEYDANQVSADSKYKGKIVVVTGPISDIGKDVTDTAYVVIGGTGLLNGAQCMFPKGQESLISSLSKGQQVSVKGEVSGKIGNVLLRNCTVQ
jgi:hypothetical protein